MGPLRRATARSEFETFVRSATVELFHTAYALTWDTVQAEDLVQEAFLVVARRWDRVRSMDRPVSYARKVLVNLALAGTRRRVRQRDELAIVEDLRGLADDEAARAFRAVEDLDEFASALAQLSPRQRAAVVLRYWEDLPEAEVGAILGCTVGTVASLASRGARSLAAAFGAAEGPSSPSATERKVKC
jgi:RNA polymerase sigma-70 factor (sigma-E family)